MSLSTIKRFARVFLVLFGLAASAAAQEADPFDTTAKPAKLDEELTSRKGGNPGGVSSVIVTLEPGAQLPQELRKYARRGKLDLINAEVLDIPNSLLPVVEQAAGIASAHDNRPLLLLNYRTSITVGADVVRSQLGYTGKGIGVAVIDSGVAAWHDDLTSADGDGTVYPYGNQRVARFVDFIDGRELPYDDNGHGTHVAGTIAGNGYDSNGQKAGIAPDASLVALKVLDGSGQGTISNAIAALGWVAANYKTYNIRVVNMSVGAPIRESYRTDPFTLAAKKLTDLGITVVAAAGNFGKNETGELQYGGITAPGNAPWVLTVGASSTMGTNARPDDTVAAFSSSGPTWIDFRAKPDVVAPGVGTVSLASNGSSLYSELASYLVDGSSASDAKPYLALSGTSMAAPVVSGTVALMLEANPTLTPNLVKALLQYTAETDPDYNALQQGAGFLNTEGAVRLAEFYDAATVGDVMPIEESWSRHIIWGNYEVAGGYLNPLANAWATNVVWGVVRKGDAIVWGSQSSESTIVWNRHDVSFKKAKQDAGVSGSANIVWGINVKGNTVTWNTAADQGGNVVWGTACGGADCVNGISGVNIVWGINAGRENKVWENANIVWGIANNIVWGIRANDKIPVWGSANIVWGIRNGDENPMWGSNIVWGIRADGSHPLWPSNIVWGIRAGSDNTTWGTNIVWGIRSGKDNAIWSSANIVWGINAAKENKLWNSANIVWGINSDKDTKLWSNANIVWGINNGKDTKLWSTANIVWGINAKKDNALWSSANIVWGINTDQDNTLWSAANIVWGISSNSENVMWGTATTDLVLWDRDAQ